MAQEIDKSAMPIYTLSERRWAFSFLEIFSREALMNLTYLKRMQARLIFLLTVLPCFDLVAQFRPDLRQQLYPPFVQRDGIRQKFNWHKRQAAQKDSNVTLLGRWAWGHCYTVAARDHYAYIGNGAVFQVIDISNPANPTLIKIQQLGGPGISAIISDNRRNRNVYAFVFKKISPVGIISFVLRAAQPFIRTNYN